MPKRHKMVGWYDPAQLVRTGFEVFVSALFGKHADKRIVQAIADTGAARPRLYHEVPDEGGEFWFDYISDVGDGFDPTYSVAYHATRPELPLTEPVSGKIHETKQGQLLVFGGDEVYPTAGARDYDERLVQVYNLAFPKKPPADPNGPPAKCPSLFAIPGNHDWYDSLAVFMNLFCRGKSFCGWKTYQNRSYFAVKLPAGWWLFGTDMQLSSSLDDAQMDFFRTIVRDHMAEDERIILCNAEPYWITDKMYRDDPNYNNRNMGFFEGHHLAHRAVIHVAGDRHYYRRHEEFKRGKQAVDPASTEKKQRIVAGGGGAFLHPTHREGVDEVGRSHLYSLQASYPAEPASSRMTFRNLLFPILNPRFGFVTGGLYLLTAQAFRADLSGYGLSEWWPALKAVLSDVVYEPVATFWVVLIFAAFCLFTDTHSRYLRIVAGPMHALMHFAAVLGLGWAAAYWLHGIHPLLKLASSALMLVGGGYIIGPLVMGVYLLVMLNVFGVHHNEAFSSLALETHKNFLRFRIDPDGTLTIYPVGIEKPIKRWRDLEKTGKRAGETSCVPAADPLPAHNRPFLIEPPITYAKPFRAHTAGRSVGPTAKSAAAGAGLIEHPVEI